MSIDSLYSYITCAKKHIAMRQETARQTDMFASFIKLFLDLMKTLLKIVPYANQYDR